MELDLPKEINKSQATPKKTNPSSNPSIFAHNSSCSYQQKFDVVVEIQNYMKSNNKGK